jgi:hypothetical protein
MTTISHYDHHKDWLIGLIEGQATCKEFLGNVTLGWSS